MKIYNTMAREKQEFRGQKVGEYRIYVCGPTVYNFIHVGNARPLCVFDTLRRYLLYSGNEVLFVSNITDIDDRLINAAIEQKTTVEKIAAKFEKEYIKDSDGLNVMPPTAMPRATEHIAEIIEMIQTLIDKEYAYVAKNKDVYFRARKFEEYGKLSHIALDELQSSRDLGGDVSNDLKEEAADFAVWKAAKEGEPEWKAPWGKGRPGWHIECSAMAKKHLGNTIDLHGGGQDLVFPHHENEIAQSECTNGETFAKYWMHNGFVNIEDRKMSKSLGNFFTVRQVAKEFGYEPIRYFMLSAHYRTPVNFTKETMEQCKTSLDRLYTCRRNLETAIKSTSLTGENELKIKALTAEKSFRAAMDDDLNTADALAVIFELVRDINILLPESSKGSIETASEVFDRMVDVLGLLYSRKKKRVPKEVLDTVQEREQARADKNWILADLLRNKVEAEGFLIGDTSDGPQVTAKA